MTTEEPPKFIFGLTFEEILEKMNGDAGAFASLITSGSKEEAYTLGLIAGTKVVAAFLSLEFHKHEAQFLVAAKERFATDPRKMEHALLATRHVSQYITEVLIPEIETGDVFLWSVKTSLQADQKEEGSEPK